MGRLRYGRYETLGLIASGGMASVHLGRACGPAGFERLVAIKVMHPHIAGDPEFSSMFLDEARLAAQIRHPNVVPTLDVSEDGRIIVMEYVEGASLSAILRHMDQEGERVPLSCALRIGLDMLDGLHAAHELRGKDGASLNLVHRDISPHNVLVGVDGISRITDFGIAYAESRLTSTRGSQLKGKMPYMAPEQLEGVEVDRMVDVYAAGVVLWELLAGRRLFRAENDAALACRVLAGPEHSPRQLDGSIPAPLDRVVMKALARREGRYRSAVNFAEALEVAASESSLAVARPRSVAYIARQAQAVITPPPSSQLVSMGGAPGASTTQPGHGDPDDQDAAPKTAAPRTGGAPDAGPDGAAARPARSAATHTAAPRGEDSVPAARAVPAQAANQQAGGERGLGEPAAPEHDAPPAELADGATKTSTPVLGSARNQLGLPSTLVSETGEARAGLDAILSTHRSAESARHLADESPAPADSAMRGEAVGNIATEPSGGYEHTATGASLVAPIPGLPRRNLPRWALTGMLTSIVVGGASAWWLLGTADDGGSGGSVEAGAAPSGASGADGGGGAPPTSTSSPTGAAGTGASGANDPPAGSTRPNPRPGAARRPSPAGTTTFAPAAAATSTAGALAPSATPTPSPPPAPAPSASPPPATTDTAFHPPRL